MKNRITSKVANAIGILAFLGSFLINIPATAGGVTVSVSPTSSSSSPQEVNITWTASQEYVTSTTITIDADPVFTSIDDCATPDDDINNDGTNDGGSTTTSTSQFVYTVTSSTGSGDLTMDLCIELTFDTDAQNYQLALTAADSGGQVDFGAVLFYANGGNQVTVTADVKSTLSFSIRNAADTADTTTCSMGTLSLSSTSTCSYRLRIATNAGNGFQAQIQADQDFGTGSATMTNVTNDSSSPSAGTELYGLSLVRSATEGGRNTTTLLFTEPAVEDSPTNFTFDTDPSPVPTSSAQNFISYNAQFQAGGASSATTTSFVEHAASIDAGTAAGTYQQVVTYTVTGSF